MLSLQDEVSKQLETNIVRLGLLEDMFRLHIYTYRQRESENLYIYLNRDTDILY